MPERRIDAIGKAAPSSWHATALPKSSPHLLKVISGRLSQMPAGEVMGAVVQKAANGAFKITLNGETFIIKGLPASLLGSEVNFVARQTMAQGKPGIGLFWLGQGKAKHAAAEPPAISRVRPLSKLPATLGSRMQNMNIPGQIETIQAGSMTIAVALPDQKHPSRLTRHQLQTTPASSFKPGQPVFVRLAAAGDTPALDILPRAQTGNTAAGSAAGKPTAAPEMASLPFSAGDITAAVVQKRLPGGQIQLNIGGVTVEAPAPAHLEAGDLLTLRMSRPPAGFQLLSVQKNSAKTATAVVKQNLSASHTPLSQTLTAIRNLLPGLQAAAPSLAAAIDQLERWYGADTADQFDSKRLATLLRDSGAGLEAKLLRLAQPSSQPTGQQAAILQDLKAILLQLSGLRSSAARHGDLVKTLAELAHHGAARIETTQALNALAHIQGDPIRFELPMLVGQQLVNVQLSMQQQEQAPEQQEGGKSRRSFNVLFAMELSGLGKLRVDSAVSGQSVHARIYSDRADASTFIHEHITRLRARLQGMGYQDVMLLAAQTPPDAETSHRFDQLAAMAPTSLNLLDVIA